MQWLLRVFGTFASFWQGVWDICSCILHVSIVFRSGVLLAPSPPSWSHGAIRVSSAVIAAAADAAIDAVSDAVADKVPDAVRRGLQWSLRVFDTFVSFW